jgi:diamine N-acetyltransferase
MTIEFREITRNNFRECIRMELGPGQGKSVASNAFSLAESKFKPGYEPFAIYESDRMIGFIMLGHEKHEDKSGQYWIIRLMIEKDWQRNGFGEAATRMAMEKMAAYRDCEYICVGTGTANLSAEKLYLKCGFRKTGEIVEGETQFIYDNRSDCTTPIRNDVISKAASEAV